MPRKPIRLTKSSRRSPRPKLDPRLSLILSLPEVQLKALHEYEQQRLNLLSEEIASAAAELHRQPHDRSLLARMTELEGRLFAPMTTGVYFPPPPRTGPAGPAR